MVMRYLVVSDIHGSRSGAALVQELFHELHADAILCLGDVLYHGPRNNLPEDYAPKEVISILNPLAPHIFAVRGNCDAEVDQMVLNFPLTADYNEFLLGSHKVFMTHGHVYGPDHLPKLVPGDIFLYGHTHIPMAAVTEEVLLLNPGSVSLPKGGHPKTYAVLEEDEFTICTLDRKPYLNIRF